MQISLFWKLEMRGKTCAFSIIYYFLCIVCPQNSMLCLFCDKLITTRKLGILRLPQSDRGVLRTSLLYTRKQSQFACKKEQVQTYTSKAFQQH